MPPGFTPVPQKKEKSKRTFPLLKYMAVLWRGSHWNDCQELSTSPAGFGLPKWEGAQFLGSSRPGWHRTSHSFSESAPLPPLRSALAHSACPESSSVGRLHSGLSPLMCMGGSAPSAVFYGFVNCGGDPRLPGRGSSCLPCGSGRALAESRGLVVSTLHTALLAAVPDCRSGFLHRLLLQTHLSAGPHPAREPLLSPAG